MDVAELVEGRMIQLVYTEEDAEEDIAMKAAPSIQL